MKVIDEQGRLFGKINVVDLLVILFLIGLIPAFYAGYKIMTAKPVEVPAPTIEVPKEFIDIEMRCKFTKINQEVLKLISVGDQEVDEDGRMIGEVIQLGESTPYKLEFDIGEEEKIIKEIKDLKDLEVTLRLKTQIKDNKLYYKDRLISLASPLEFTSNKYSLSAVPYIYLYKDVTMKIRIKFENLDPEICRLIKAGDSQLSNSKEVMARIVKIISDRPSEVVYLNRDGTGFNILEHPQIRDIILDIEIFCLRNSEGVLFQGKPVKVGKAFEFSTNRYFISGMIIDIDLK